MNRKIAVFRIEVKRLAVKDVLEEGDLISIAEAAKLRDVSISSITSMMDSGTLPTYQLTDLDLPGVRAQRFTSRAAVEALGKLKGGNRSDAHNKSYISPLQPRDVPVLMAGISG
jgi:hypothetical protein